MKNSIRKIPNKKRLNFQPTMQDLRYLLMIPKRNSAFNGKLHFYKGYT